MTLVRATRIVGFSLAILFVLFLADVKVSAIHVIAGTIFDTNRMPIPDVDVELLDDLGRTLQRQKTGSAGRFEFTVSTARRYTVRVFAFRLDYEDQSEDIDVAAVSAVPGEAGSSYNALDFYLRPRKGGMLDAEAATIFAQEVPAPAKKLYETALKDLSAKRTVDGIRGLNDAIDIMPTYYMALNRIGKELFIQGRYQEAVPFLLKAVEVNPKSTTSLYYLGGSLYYMGKDYYKASMTSLVQAAVLAPGSPQVQFVLGRVQRRLDKFVEAEQSLLKAKKLAASPIPDIHMELAQLYADDLKKFAQAADELEAYMKASGQKGADQEKTRQVIANLRAKAKTPASK